jgi:dTDP-4-amino-4,6-dideoxygalactose transaminase
MSARHAAFPEEEMPELLAEIAAVLRSGRLILGPRTRELEEAWARRCGVRHAVALSSCTAALEIAMRYARVAGREVIVPTNTFVAAPNAVGFAGGRVVFCDMSRADFGLDVDDALARLGPDTAAVIVVHVAGFVAHGMARLVVACRARKVVVVEDCAHAHGATLDGRSVGGLGDIGCWSFHANKIVTSGVGGMLTTDRGDVAELARALRNHGERAGELHPGGNDWVLDEVRAVLALAQLRRLDDGLARRRALAARYRGLLARRDRYTLPRVAPDSAPAYYKFPLLLPIGVDREAVRAALARDHGIETAALYGTPAHLLPMFRPAAPPERLPNAEALLPRQIALPVAAGLDAEVSIAALDAVLARQR